MPSKPPRYPPHDEVSEALASLGARLREARLRRDLSIDALARGLRMTRRTIADAEHGKPSTGIGVYAEVLWALGLLEQLSPVATLGAEPDSDFATETARRRAPRAGTTNPRR